MFCFKPAALAVKVTVAVLAIVAGGVYLTLSPVVVERVPRFGSKDQLIASLEFLRVALKVSALPPAVTVLAEGDTSSVGVGVEPGQAVRANARLTNADTRSVL